MWLVPKIWDGADVWILGGGPSVASLFGIPDQLVYDVRTGQKPMKAFSPYMKAIHDKQVIGINVAYRLGDWVSIMFCGDKGFVLQHEKELKSYNGIKVSCHSIASKPERNDWKYTPKDNRKGFGITENPYKVSWNLNSGGAAISLACNLGAKRIILLGFDMNIENGYQHFHNAYKRGVIKPEDHKRKRGLPFDRHLKGFPTIKADADRLGVEILNTSLNSSIECFKKVDIKELL
jgi:hypothetical protein